MAKFCLNPVCRHPSAGSDLCPKCGIPVVLTGRYQLLHPIKLINEPFLNPGKIEVWEVQDLKGNAYCPPGGRQIMRMQFAPYGQAEQQFLLEQEFLLTCPVAGVPRSEGDKVHLQEDSAPELLCFFQEKIDGQTLLEMIKTSPQPGNERVFQVAKDLAKILVAVHEKRWMHGDIKPSNVMVRPDGSVALIDWGGVQRIDEKFLSALSTGQQPDPIVFKLIAPEYTPIYGGQEQVLGKLLPQSDLHGLGMTLIHYATGQHPAKISFNPESYTLKWHGLAPTIEPFLKEWIDRCVSVNVAHRPVNIELALGQLDYAKVEFEEAKSAAQKKQLQWWQENRQKKLQRWRWSAIAFLAGLASLLGIGYVVGAVRYSQNSVAVVEAARQAEQMGDLKLARQLYEQGITQNPNEALLFNNLGLVCQSLVDFVCAERNLKRASVLEPNKPFAYYNLGVLAEDRQDWVAARNYYQKAISRGNGKFISAANNLARLENLAGQPDKALQTLSQINLSDMGPKEKWGYLKNKGWSFLLKENYNKAIPLLEAATKADPSRADPYCLLAIAARAKRQPYAVYLESCDSRWSIVPEVKDWQNQLR